MFLYISIHHFKKSIQNQFRRLRYSEGNIGILELAQSTNK